MNMRTGRTATMMRINTRTRTNRRNVNRIRTERIRRMRMKRMKRRKMRMRKRRMKRRKTRMRKRRRAPALQKTKLLRLLSTLPLYSLQMKSDHRSTSPISSASSSKTSSIGKNKKSKSDHTTALK